MIPAPANVAELAKILAGANVRKENVERADLAALNRVVEHTPEDMTVTVEAGITLAELQKHVGQRRQWLAIDPPHPETTTIGDIINANSSGPRRFGCGTIRDYLIGLTAVAPRTVAIIHSGGKVVKNVAGYDSMKLFVGGQGTVGVVAETTSSSARCRKWSSLFPLSKSLEEADKLIESVMRSEVTPVVLDLHKPSASEPGLTIILGFAGSEEEVEWQLARVSEFGFTQKASLDYERDFWTNPAPAEKLSVLPSRIIDAIGPSIRFLPEWRPVHRPRRQWRHLLSCVPLVIPTKPAVLTLCNV